jgi:hypothetical protein
MVGVVVLLQSQGLAVEAALNVAQLMAQPLKLGVVVQTVDRLVEDHGLGVAQQR